MMIRYSLLLLMFSVLGVHAATRNAASVSRTDVKAAIDASAVGDTVHIPAGTATWSQGVTITKGIYIIGAGTNLTHINNSQNGESPIFDIDLTADNPVEISGIWFEDASNNYNSDGIHISDESVHEEQVRIYNCVFESFIFGIWVHAGHGVVHDSLFINCDHSFRVVGYYPGDVSSHSPSPPWAWNSPHYWVMEDCRVIYNGRSTDSVLAFDTEFPANYMIRHCQVDVNRSGSQWFDFIDMHGRSGDSGIENRVGIVIYSNTLNFTGNTDGGARFADIRGGKYNLVYSNRVHGVDDIYMEFSANPSGSPRPTDSYVWANTVDGGSFSVRASDGVTLNRDYWLAAPGNFSQLAYPHPLRGSTPPDGTAPSVPEELTATASGNSINLSWNGSTDNVGVVGYNIYRDGELHRQTSGTGTTFADTGLVAQTSYCYRVSARDSQNESAQSTEACAVTGAAPPAGIYFVNSSHPSANDNNPGTEALPWKTISKANVTLQAGETVYLKAGTYNSYVAPQNTGTMAAPISYLSSPGDTVVIHNTPYAVHLRNKSWIRVSGVRATDCQQYLVLDNAMNNTVDSCVFSGNTDAQHEWSASRIYNDSKSNRILNCTFAEWGYYGGGDDVGTLLDIGDEDLDSNDQTQFILIEGCQLYHGGHHCLGVFGRYNIIRNNHIHNELWLNGYGNRCLWVHGAPGTTGWNLFEGNRISYSADPVDNVGGQGMLLASSSNIIRRNSFYKNNVCGLMLSWSGYYSSPSENRIYHNSFFDNFHYPNPSETDSALESAIGVAHYGEPGADYQDHPITGNVFINNLMWENPTAFGYYISSRASGAARDGIVTNQVYAGNWNETSNPRFVSAPTGMGNPFADGVNLALQTSSPCVDEGVFLTTVTSSTGSGTSLVVADAHFFVDGWGMIEGDLVQLQGSAEPVRVVRVDYDANRLYLERSINWTKGQGLALAYQGSAPDIGAHEVPTGVKPSPPQNLRIQGTP